MSLKTCNRSDENLQVQNIEDLIYKTKDIFIKNTIQKTGKEFSSIELAEVNKIVNEFFKS
jgi:hypothetical protein